MLPHTWGWTGFGLIIMAIVLAGIWAVAQWFQWLAPGYGGKILMVCFVLLPVGVAHLPDPASAKLSLATTVRKTKSDSPLPCSHFSRKLGYSFGYPNLL